MSVKIGKAKFGNQNQQRKYFKLKDGEQVYRILPPIGELADQGRWSVFHSVHYGYKTTDGKQKPFLGCEVKNRKNGMIEVPDAAKDRITLFKAKLEEAKKTKNKALEDSLETLVGQNGIYNLDNNHYMNVIDAQGNIGILKIRHKAKLALEAEIKRLNAEGIDPLSPENGRYFVFTRTGMGRDTTFSVRVLTEKIVENGRTYYQEVVHTLDEGILGRLETEAGQLNKIFKSLTSEEVKQIVESSDLQTGVSPVLDKIFGKNQSTNTDDLDATAEAEVEETNVSRNPSTAIASSASPTLRTQPVTATTTPVTAPTTTKVVAPKTQAAAISQMSTDEFLRQLEEGTLS